MANITEQAVYISPIYNQFHFWLLLFGEVMSFPCYLFMFYHLLALQVAREAIQNHAIISMLILNFIDLAIDLSMTLNYARLGYVSAFSPAVCLLQQFVDYGIWYGAIFVMLWTSIERHILIFHSILVATARGRLLFHYIPLVVFSLYAPLLYFYLIVLYPSERDFNVLENMCGGPTYYYTVPDWFIWYELLANYTIPILLITVFSVGLIVRVIVHKRRLQQAVSWRRHRKMIIQLVFVSAVYLIFDLPLIIIIIVQWSGISTFGTNILSPYITNLTYVPAIVLPFATLVTLPDLKKKLRALLICRANRRSIAPFT